ncbi:LamG-like jellyroll fold domain-containing protein, partial [Streptomyces sp. NPDC058964]|uniref:LamG-like jellyroll fold domain-containing protein n=1 Tax=Streptomyces sp. NPDC058964 TaxID=3346681 RepID=UPI0036CA601C
MPLIDGGNGRDPSPVLTITMAAIGAVHGAQPGFPVTVRGTWRSVDFEGPFTVEVTAGGLVFPATVGDLSWSATVRFYRVGSVPVIARIKDAPSGVVRSTITQNVAVTLDSPIVDVAVTQPAAGVVRVGEGGTDIAVQATTTPGFGQRRVTWTVAGPSGWSASGGTTSSPDGRVFSSSVRLPATPLGRFTLTMSATAIGPSGAEVDPALAQVSSVSVDTVDAAPPRLDVRLPTPDQSYVVTAVPGGAPAYDVPVALSASDSQSHVQTVACSVDGGAPTTLLTADGPFSGTVRVSGYGGHVLTFTAVDAAPRAAGDTSGTTVVAVPITVRSDYRPATLEERLDDRAYLSALLDLARTQVLLRTGVAAPPRVTVTDLERVTYLGLGDLTQPLSGVATAGSQPVSRLQLAVETLRRYLALTPHLVAGRWDFAAPTGADTVPDLSGHGLDLTLAAGAVLGAGPGGRRTLVLGTDSGAAAPADAGPRIGDNGTDFTVAFWINVAADSTGAWRAVMHRGAVDAERTFAIWLRPGDNGLHVRVSTTANGNEGIDGTSPLTVGTWTHVVVIKAGNRLDVYLDGRLDSTAALSAPSVGNAGPLRIGRDSFFGGFAGSIAALEVLTEAVPDSLVPGLAGVTWPAAGTVAEGLAAYGDAVYESLLQAFGLSSAELRLSRGADPGLRDEVAARLGVRLAVAPTALDDLTLAAGARTESDLERLFGLPSTDPTLQPARLLPPSQLSSWREATLTQRWSEEDAALDPAVAGFQMLVDPDVITPDDLTLVGRTGLAGSLLADRTAEIAVIAADLHAVRAAQPTQPAALAAVLDRARPGVDLIDLAARRDQGRDIGPALAAANLSEPAFAMLRTVAGLAALGTVQADEWSDVEALLTRVTTLGLRGRWRTEETGVSLTQASFTDDGPAPTPIPWRTDLAARGAWLRRLRSRAAELSASRDELGAAISSAQAAALPLLRDSLLVSIEGRTATAEVARWLDVRLGTDVLVGPGSPATTRLRAAGEVVTGLLEALRGARLPAWHPARSWRIDDESQFDASWRWHSDPDGWVSAMLTWLYPENLLSPDLAPLATPAFTALVNDLRAQQIGVDEVRWRANLFLAPLRGSVEAGLRAPRARWPLDEDGGGKARDTSGGGQDLDVVGAVSARGLFGPALAFDGGDAVVDVPDPVFGVLAPVVNDFTLSFWAFPTAPHKIDAQATSGASGTSGQRYALGPAQAGSRFADPTAAGAGVSVGTNGVSVYEHGDGHLPAVLVYAAPITGWTHVTVVYEGRRPRLYVDGVLVASAENPSSKATVYAVPDQLGNTRSGDLGGGSRVPYGAFQGLLSDVRIFPFVLSTTEIGQVSFRLTEQRSSSGVERLQTLAAALFAPVSTPRTNPAATALREVFWSAPVLLAQALARSGQYAAALDWFQTVWSLNLPAGSHAVYPVLAVETNRAVDLSPVGDWTSRLNPHTVAGRRPNPYTRFTLATIAQCLMDYGDTEFARGLDTTVAAARALYETAGAVLDSRDLDFLGAPPGAAEVAFPNPALAAQRTTVAARLAKLRQGRDLAGVPRVSTAPDSATTLAAGPGAVASTAVALRPTPYRYRVLQDRARQLVSLAQQVEQEYLSALEKYDAAEFRRFDARKGVEVAEQNAKLQGLRVTEADDGVRAAEDQKARADFLGETYTARISAGLNGYERDVLQNYMEIRDLKNVVTGLDAAIGVAQAASTTGSLLDIVFSGGAKIGIAAGISVAQIAKGVATGFLNGAEARLSANSFMASHERQVDEWKLQKGLAEKDSRAAEHAWQAAKDHKSVVAQEKAVAELQLTQANATVTFLDRQFTSAELYAWMAGVLGGVYRYFLQLATTTGGGGGPRRGPPAPGQEVGRGVGGPLRDHGQGLRSGQD